MLDINELKKRLSDRNLMEVARRTGLSYGVLQYFAKDGGPKPQYDTVKILSDYLECEHEREKEAI